MLLSSVLSVSSTSLYIMMDLSHYLLLVFLTISASQSEVIGDVVPDAYWLMMSNRYNSSLAYLQDHNCSSVQHNIGHVIDDDKNQSKREGSVLLRCAQPSALFDGKIGRDFPQSPEAGDLLKHYTWKKAITPNPFVAMEFISPLTELTNITLYFYKDGKLNIHLPRISLCVSTSRDVEQCSKVEISPRPWSSIGVVVWPVMLLTPVKSVTFLNISFQYEVENIHQWIFLSEVRVGASNQTQGAVCNISIQPVSQTKVRVNWQPPQFPISDLDQLQYRIYWDDVAEGSTLSVESTRQSSDLLPFSQNHYQIKSLSPTYKLSVIIVTYYADGREIVSSPVKGRTYGTIPAEIPGSIIVTHTSTNMIIDSEVRWNTIVPNHDQGEGDVYQYDIRYYECGEEANPMIINGDHPPVMSDQQMAVIPNTDPAIEYSIQVRVIVLIQSEPDVKFGVGRWSGDGCKESTGSTEGSSAEVGTVGIIAGTVMAISITALVITVICVVILLQWRKRRLMLTHDSKDNDNIDKSTTLTVTVPDYATLNISNNKQEVKMTVNPSYGTRYAIGMTKNPAYRVPFMNRRKPIHT